MLPETSISSSRLLWICGWPWQRALHTRRWRTRSARSEIPLAAECGGVPAPAFPAGCIASVFCWCPATEMETAVAPGRGRGLSSETTAGRGPRGSDADVSCRGFRSLVGPLLTAGGNRCRTQPSGLAARPRRGAVPRVGRGACSRLIEYAGLLPCLVE